MMFVTLSLGFLLIMTYDLVKYNQHRFFYRIWKERSECRDDPLVFVINTIKSKKAKYSNHVIEIKQAMQSVINSISESDPSKRLTYEDINPKLVVHDL